MTKQIRILIADDEPGIRMVASRALQSEGFLITETSDGMEAYRAALSQPFDLILLDVNMDGMNNVHPRHKANLDSRRFSRRQRNAFYGIADEHLVKDLVDDCLLLYPRRLHLGEPPPRQELRPDGRDCRLHSLADNRRNRRNRRDAGRDFLHRSFGLNGMHTKNQAPDCEKCGGNPPHFFFHAPHHHIRTCCQR
nr:response regulator [Schwartzia sp. (in: firmicutes)]